MPAIEEPIGIDDERADLQLDDGSEGSIDLFCGAGFQHNSFNPFSWDAN